MYGKKNQPQTLKPNKYVQTVGNVPTEGVRKILWDGTRLRGPILTDRKEHIVPIVDVELVVEPRPIRL